MDTTNTHGGARRNAGRKTERHDLEVTKATVSLDDKTKRLLKVLGRGNSSRGIRFAAEVVYDLYQRGKIELPEAGA